MASVYARPHAARRPTADFQWMDRLRAMYPYDEAIIGGDFNAANPTWGYCPTGARGMHLAEEAEDADLTLANDITNRRASGCATATMTRPQTSHGHREHNKQVEARE